MRITKTAVHSRTARIGVVTAVTAACLVGTAAPAFAATPGVISLGTTQGPSGGGNTLILNVPAATSTSTAFSPGPMFVEFQMVGAVVTPVISATVTVASLVPPAAATKDCWPTYLTGIPISATGGVLSVPAPNSVYYSPTKAYVTVPAGGTLGTPVNGGTPAVPPTGLLLASGQANAKYNVCVYSSASTSVANLIAGTNGTQPATGQYSIASKATFSSITPASGPAQGKISVTIVGTNFTPAVGTAPTTMTATLGGTPLQITSVADAGNSFTANVPPHAASATPVDLVITTAGGATTFAGVFTYTNGIVVAPNTEPNTTPRGVYLDVMGVGFSGLNFTTTTGTTPDDTNAHIYLVGGVYNAAPDSNSHKTVGESSECVDVRVIADNELICSPYPGLSVVNGAAQLMTRTIHVSTSVTGGSTKVLTATSGDLFTSADVGLSITEGSSANIAANAVIQSVASNGTTANVDLDSLQAAPVTATIGARPVSSVTISTLTSLAAAASFYAQDVNRAVLGAGIQIGTTIVGTGTISGVTTGTATLSAAATNGTQGLTIGNPAPVPTGVYTLTIVSNGAVGATGYTQSIISSGSTFTVAGY